MKTSICLCLLLASSFLAAASPDRNSGKSPDTEFQARYHRWVAAIYDHPGTRLSSSSGSYIDFPEYDTIVELGKPALPSIANAIEASGDMAMFFGEAIIRITGWNRADFYTPSLQDQNRALIQRLRAEGLIPPRSS